MLKDKNYKAKEEELTDWFHSKVFAYHHNMKGKRSHYWLGTTRDPPPVIDPLPPEEKLQDLNEIKDLYLSYYDRIRVIALD